MPPRARVLSDFLWARVYHIGALDSRRPEIIRNTARQGVRFQYTRRCLFRHRGIVELLGATIRIAVGDAGNVALKCRALVDCPELQAPTHLRADVDIRGGKAVAGQVLAVADGGLER